MTKNTAKTAQVTKQYYGLFKQPNSADVFWVVADSTGKITSIINLYDGTRARGISGTKFYLNYVVDTKILFDSIIEAVDIGVVTIME